MYDDANQIATFGGTSFSYDDNGNLTSDGVRSYTWNARNQLTSLTGPVNGSFAYDGFGRRRGKTVGGTTTQFLYDGLNPVQELSGGTPTANLLTGLGIDEYFTRTDAAGVRNFLTDALGSSVALVDGSGGVQTEYTYQPFGATTTSGASTTNAHAFTGREADGTGLYYYRARYYHPGAQRFASEDPLGFAAGDTNLHAYTSNRPTIWTDPSGEFAIPLLLCAGGPEGRRLPTGSAAASLILSRQPLIARLVRALVLSVRPSVRRRGMVPEPVMARVLGWQRAPELPFPSVMGLDTLPEPVSRQRLSKRPS